MALTINTNLSSLIVQSNLQKSTKGLNTAIERMTTGSKINHAKDNAANYGISVDMETKMSAYQVAEDNVAMGLDLLNTVSEALDLVSGHLTRIRDLFEQGCNGTYGEDSLSAIEKEIGARADEIERIFNTTEYNGIQLFRMAEASNASQDGDLVTLQMGINALDTEQVQYDKKVYAYMTEMLSALRRPDVISKAFSGEINIFNQMDWIFDYISTRQVECGASQNRLESAAEQISVAYENLASSHSTIKDSDVAKESSTYIKNQILQQASATLLATANQSPSLALQLL